MHQERTRICLFLHYVPSSSQQNARTHYSLYTIEPNANTTIMTYIVYEYIKLVNGLKTFLFKYELFLTHLD